LLNKQQNKLDLAKFKEFGNKYAIQLMEGYKLIVGI